MGFPCPCENRIGRRSAYSTTSASIVLLFRPLWRRRFVSKFAMTDSSAGIGDVNPASQGHGAEQDHRNSEWDGRLGPFDWRSDGNCAQSGQCIENPDEIFPALFVFIEPGLSILVRH